ncbi:TatD family hydrolase [Paenibacillus sp. CAU 1782]
MSVQKQGNESRDESREQIAKTTTPKDILEGDAVHAASEGAPVPGGGYAAPDWFRIAPQWSASEPYRCIDAHLHVDQYSEGEREKLLEQSFEDGVEAVVAVSMGLRSSQENRRLAERYSGRILPAYGWHPEQEPLTLPARDELISWIKARHESGEKFAIGEVGLPYYKRTEAEANGEAFDEKPYLDCLESFISLAAELDRPLALHAVYEDADKVLLLLRNYGISKAHFHWFKGSQSSITAMAAAGYMISVTPDVAYEEEIRKLVESYPLELLLAETDGPWPFEGPYSGHTTVPSMTRGVIRDIAAIKGLTERATAKALLSNTKRYYGIG